VVGGASSSEDRVVFAAGEWAVFCRRSYGCYLSHEVGVIDAVKPKTIYAKIGFGRRLNHYSHDDVIPARDEAHARLIRDHLDSAKAEAQRREREAGVFYKKALGKTYAQAIEARRAETQGGSVHESAVLKGCAQDQEKPL
jgi:hypothetical protein